MSMFDWYCFDELYEFLTNDSQIIKWYLRNKWMFCKVHFIFKVESGIEYICWTNFIVYTVIGCLHSLELQFV